MLPRARMSRIALSFLLLIAAARSENLYSVGYDETEPCSAPSTPGSCPIKCFRADPVCGKNGVTYWCGCPDAGCAMVPVVKKGPCDGDSGGSSHVRGQAFLIIHILWLIVVGFSILCGLL